MSIQEFLKACKQASWLKSDEMLAFIIVLVGLCGFYLGRISVENGDANVAAAVTGIPTREVRSKELEVPASPGTTTTEKFGLEQGKGAYVGSKSGTKYHLPWCPGAQQMKEENKIWFDTKEEAEAAGYTPASNCKGI